MELDRASMHGCRNGICDGGIVYCNSFHAAPSAERKSGGQILPLRGESLDGRHSPEHF